VQCDGESDLPINLQPYFSPTQSENCADKTAIEKKSFSKEDVSRIRLNRLANKRSLETRALKKVSYLHNDP
jgi:hypothetical protein